MCFAFYRIGCPGDETTMNSVPARTMALTGLGVASLVLGNIGLMLFVFPVLGLPISVIGLVLGIVAISVPATRRGRDLRYCFYGILLSGAALSVNIAIAMGPSGLASRLERPRPGPLGTPEPNQPSPPERF
jgi:hypothetical protein